MKSVVAEASSISKAVELAWQKAGQPKEFLVKVFQEPQRNMFGLTKTSAKVGIFFDDAALTQKIKNATQSTIATTHNNKTVNPISPIKPITNRPQAPKQAAPKQNKPQPKIEPMLSASIVEAPKPANPRKNTQPNRQAQNKPKPMPVAPESALPVDSLPQQQVFTNTPELKPSEHLIDTNLPANVNIAAGELVQTAPRPARKKYYRRRRPKGNRPNTGEGGEQTKVVAPSNKSED